MHHESEQIHTFLSRSSDFISNRDSYGILHHKKVFCRLEQSIIT